VPDLCRHLGAVADDEEDPEFAHVKRDQPPQFQIEDVVRSALRQGGWKGPVQVHEMEPAGPLAFMNLVQRLTGELLGPAMILSLDSLVDEGFLLALDAAKRLKSNANPVGIPPGEAAVALWVAPHDPAGAGLAVLETAGFGTEEQDPAEEPVAKGLALSAAIRASLAGSTFASSGPPWLISPHSGGVFTAAELGLSLRRLSSGSPEFLTPTITYPAASFGDTGCSAPALSVALAAAAWRRGYAPSEQCYVLASGAPGASGALSLRNANFQGGA
jgi:hypothetical protein